jgi:hypothetical protein
MAPAIDTFVSNVPTIARGLGYVFRANPRIHYRLAGMPGVRSSIPAVRASSNRRQAPK